MQNVRRAVIKTSVVWYYEWNKLTWNTMYKMDK